MLTTVRRLTPAHVVLLVLAPLAGCAPSGGPCAQATDCVACAELVGCDWCAGSCQATPPGSLRDDAWCEWGYVYSAEDCGTRDLESDLPVDCRSSRNEAEPECIDVADDGADPIGTGVSLGGGIFGGFLDRAGGRAIVAVESSGPDVGGIIAIDLATGNRTLVSGQVVDPRLGVMMAGSGPEFGVDVYDVEPAPDGSWVAQAADGYFRVEPATGARTLLFSDATLTCMHARLSWNFGSSTRGFAIGSDGTIYVPLGYHIPGPTDGGNETGLIAISPDGSTCTVISAISDVTARVLGTGPLTPGSWVSLAFSGSTLYALEEFGRVLSVDTTTGNRTLVSYHQAGEDVGDGLPSNEDWLTAGPSGTLWTSGGDILGSFSGTLAMVEVDIASGDRTARRAHGAPLGGYDATQWTAPHPTEPAFAVVASGDRLSLLERATGNANVISRP